MGIYIFILLLIASSYFSASETAFLSINKIRLKQLESVKKYRAKKVVKLLSDPHKLIITVLVGNTMVNIAASAVLADIFYSYFGERGVVYSIFALTGIILVFGEVTPKMFALSYGEQMAFFSAPIFGVIEWVLTPLRAVLSNISYFMVKIFGVKFSNEYFEITEQEIRSILSAGKKEGVVKKKEKDMIDNILELKELNAADIMSPRIDVIALDMNSTAEELRDIMQKHQYSRYPVYAHNLDNIVGLIHTKDLLLDTQGDIKDLMRKPFFAPESMRVDNLLHSLQRAKTHMAVITDEYGVTSGIVTIEDITEKIVGDIRDELDLEKPNIRKIDEKRYELSGQTHINEVNAEIGVNIETEEVDTIGGYFILKAGKIPQNGDSIEVNGFLITVNDVSKNRITRLMIERE